MVTDDELLYRRVTCWPGLELFKIVDGKVRFSSQAFADRSRKPSVDRAHLTNFQPEFTQQAAQNGVTSLIAGEVRSITTVVRETKQEKVLYIPDVTEDPILAAEGVTENLAHAIVITNPDIPSQNVFYRLQVALALLANHRGWVIAPAA